MSKKLLLLLFCMNLLPFYIFAQTQKWKPTAVAEASLLLGGYGPSGDLRARVGMQKNGWLVGVGSGLDFYRYQTVPLFLNAQKEIGKKKHKPIVLASVGVNLPALTESQKTASWNGPIIMIWPQPAPVPHNYDTGLYAELGAGYTFFNSKGNGLMLSVSYVYKSTTEWYNSATWLGSTEGNPSREEIKYLMHRVAIRAGWKF